jgi:hypothetical protein
MALEEVKRWLRANLLCRGGVFVCCGAFGVYYVRILHSILEDLLEASDKTKYLKDFISIIVNARVTEIGFNRFEVGKFENQGRKV